MAFQPDIIESEYIQCPLVFLRDNDADRFFEFPLILGRDCLRETMSVKEDRVGCRDGFEGGCKGGLTQFRGALQEVLYRFSGTQPCGDGCGFV